MRHLHLSPANLFLLIWLFPLLAPYLIESSILLKTEEETKWLVYSSILFFYLITLFFHLTGAKGKTSSALKSVHSIDYLTFEKKFRALLKIWITIYFINIIGSGGLPIIWILTGDPRTYADFGLPTLGGLSNLFRAFLLTSCYLFVFHSNFNKRKKYKYKLIALSLILSAFVIEASRGAGVVLLLHPIGIYFLLNNISFLRAFKWLSFILLFLLFLGFVQMFRYSGKIDVMQDYAESSGFEEFTGISVFYIPAITYIAVPLVNTDLTIRVASELKFSPYYTIQGLIPSAIRDSFFEKGDYGQLINEANNASSFYVPFLRDYGYFGTIIIFGLIQIFLTKWYYKARAGHILYILSWPPFFMSITLSFFSSFFTSLVVVLYPILTLVMLKGCINKQN